MAAGDNRLESFVPRISAELRRCAEDARHDQMHPRSSRRHRRELATAADADQETAAVLLVGIARTTRGLRLLGRELHWVPLGSDQRRGSDHLQIASSGFVPALARAEQIGAERDVPAHSPCAHRLASPKQVGQAS